MSDNNEILANFQSITAIDDVGEAIMHLEACDWDLYAAIHRVLPPEDVVAPPPAAEVEALAMSAPLAAVPQFAAATAAAHQAALNNVEAEREAGWVTIDSSASPQSFSNFFAPDLATAHHTPSGSDASATSNAGASGFDLINEYARGNVAAAAASHQRNGQSSRTSTASAAGASGPSGSGSGSGSSSSSSSHHRTSRVKDLAFTIRHKNATHAIRLPSTATVRDLKARITAITLIPACRQALTGWPRPAAAAAATPDAHANGDSANGDAPSQHNNTTVLRSLNLPAQSNLTLTDLSDEADPATGVVAATNGSSSSSSSSGNSSTHDASVSPSASSTGSTGASPARQLDTFAITIRRVPHNEEMRLNFPGTHTLQQIKADVYSITDIPVRHQLWTGWPATMTGDTTLAAATSIQRTHAVTLRNAAAAVDNNARRDVDADADESAELIEIDSDDSEFEDATDADFNGDDDMFSEPVVRSRLTHLIIDNVDDEKLGSAQFVDNYVARYGSPHPEFFVGSLEEAMLSATNKPASQRKLLAIYLHDDRSVLTNVFCDQLLKCETIRQTLQQNFVLFGWDLTHESNKHLFLSALTCVGVTATMHVRALMVSQLPTILVVGKTRSTHEVLSIIHGNVSSDELLTKLVDTMAMYGEARAVEVREEKERLERHAMKMEQDEAYEESLEADRRKEEAKRQKAEAERAERERTEREEREDAERREAARLVAESQVPAEPPAGQAGCAKIRVRQPGGVMVERRFEGAAPLRHLLAFVASRGFPLEEYKVISSYPRRDLTTLDADRTLSDYKLCPQETVTLEER